MFRELPSLYREVFYLFSFLQQKIFDIFLGQTCFTFPGVLKVYIQNLGPIGSVVLTFIGYTDKQSINRWYLIVMQMNPSKLRL